MLRDLDANSLTSHILEAESSTLSLLLPTFCFHAVHTSFVMDFYRLCKTFSPFIFSSKDMRYQCGFDTKHDRKYNMNSNVAVYLILKLK